MARTPKGQILDISRIIEAQVAMLDEGARNAETWGPEVDEVGVMAS